jgi:RHS repeat-associated protein
MSGAQASELDPGGFGSEVTSVLYPGKHYEVRDLDEPTKYVFNGGTRVARVTTSLTANERVQRIRLQPGWNLVSLAVTADGTLLEQLAAVGNGGGGEDEAVVEGVHPWNEESGGYVELEPGQTVMAGTVLWIRARVGVTASVVGECSEPTHRGVESGGGFIAGAGLARWDIRRALDQAVYAAAWHYQAEDQRWTGETPVVPMADPDFPEFLAPGETVYVSVEAPVELELPDAALRIRYYHQDHLGSSSVLTDAGGAVVEETAFHPFGVPRHEHRLGAIKEPYQFAQKERDRESGLHYFEARYLAAVFGRFASPDPKYASPGELSAPELPAFLGQPQKLNLYAYALNNPVRYNDPTGLDEAETMATIGDVTGLAASVAEEAHVWTSTLSKGGQFVASGAGKVATGVGVAIKAGQFIQDPSMATGGQLLNEGTKTLVSVAAPPVGIIWAVLDLTGYGPSAILEHTEKSIQANRAATRAYERATKVSRESARRINEQLPGLQSKLRSIEQKLNQLLVDTARLKATRQKELKDLNAQIKSYERQIKSQKRELRHWKEVERKAKE